MQFSVFPTTFNSTCNSTAPLMLIASIFSLMRRNNTALFLTGIFETYLSSKAFLNYGFVRKIVMIQWASNIPHAYSLLASCCSKGLAGSFLSLRWWKTFSVVVYTYKEVMKRGLSLLKIHFLCSEFLHRLFFSLQILCFHRTGWPRRE